MLKNNTFYVESQFPDILRELLKNPNIRDARITDATIAAGASGSGSNASYSSSASSSSSRPFVNKSNHAATNSSGNSNMREDGFLESSAPKEDRRERELLLLDDEYYNDGEEQEGDEENGEGGGGNLSNVSQNSSEISSLKTVSFMVSQNLVHVSIDDQKSNKIHYVSSLCYGNTLVIM